CAISGIKPELLHICVTGAVKGVRARPAQLMAKLLKQPGVGQQLVLHALRQAFKLALKFLMEQDWPCHIASMYQKTYVVNSILLAAPLVAPTEGCGRSASSHASVTCALADARPGAILLAMRRGLLCVFS